MKPCDHCGHCCINPGIFLPHEIGPLADHLSLSTKELFEKHLIIIPFQVDETFVYALAPRKKQRNEIITTLTYYTSTHFFKQNKCNFWKNGCSINEVKPYGCKTLICTKMGDEVLQDDQLLIDEWKKNQQIIFEMEPKLEKINSLSELKNHFKEEDISFRIVKNFPFLNHKYLIKTGGFEHE